jgi:hypothetical protein
MNGKEKQLQARKKLTVSSIGKPQTVTSAREAKTEEHFVTMLLTIPRRPLHLACMKLLGSQDISLEVRWRRQRASVTSVILSLRGRQLQAQQLTTQITAVSKPSTLPAFQ